MLCLVGMMLMRQKKSKDEFLLDSYNIKNVANQKKWLATISYV